MSKAGRLRRQSVGDVSALLGALFGFGTARGSQPVSAPAPHRGECAPACLADSERARGVVPGDEMLSSDWLQSPLSIGTPCAVCVAGPAEPAPRLRPAPAAGAVCVWVRGRSGGSGTHAVAHSGSHARRSAAPAAGMAAIARGRAVAWKRMDSADGLRVQSLSACLLCPRRAPGTPVSLLPTTSALVHPLNAPRSPRPCPLPFPCSSSRSRHAPPGRVQQHGGGEHSRRQSHRHPVDRGV